MSDPPSTSPEPDNAASASFTESVAEHLMQTSSFVASSQSAQHQDSTSATISVTQSAGVQPDLLAKQAPVKAAPYSSRVKQVASMQGHEMQQLLPAAHPSSPQTEEAPEQTMQNLEEQLSVMRDFGSNPLMQRVQDVLLTQLQSTYHRLKDEVRVKQDDFRRVKDRREAVGVELYGQQQQLARLQAILENFQRSYGTSAQERSLIEADITKIKRTLQTRKEELEEKDKQVKRAHDELEGLNNTLRQIQQFNEKVRSEISVARRATYKVEEALQQLEKHKKGQDLYIDLLLQHLKKHKDELQVHEAHLTAQRKETVEADSVLRETAQEMDTLRFEKKQLMLHWRSSLIGVTRRDEALATAVEALREAQTAAKDYDTEIDVIKRETVRASTKNETLLSIHDRLIAESKFADEQKAKILAEQAIVAERYAMLEKSKSETLQEEGRLEGTVALLRHQVDQTAHTIQVVVRERQRIEDEIEKTKDEQCTVNKTVRSLRKSTATIVSQIHDKELEIAAAKNEYAQFQVERLGCESQVDQLRGALKKLEETLKTKDVLIAKYELETRQRNDEVEKKMYRVDRLNKKYQLMLDSAEDPECMGPLESTIRSLKKDIEKTEGECLDLQKAWLADQTRLVQNLSRCEVQTERTSELKAKAGVLRQQQIRLEQSGRIHREKAKAIDQLVVAMHKDVARINELIDKTTRLASELTSGNAVLEKGFIEKLKQLEVDSIEADVRLRDVHNQKALILDQILDTERQALLWEKKIELEKETQTALDPEAGLAECRSMEKEIHRMQLRLAALKREQEKLLQEMERAVQNHEAIALRSKGGLLGAAAAAPARAGATATGAGELTTLGLRKRMRSLKEGLQLARKDSALLTKMIERQTETRDKQSDELQQVALRSQRMNNRSQGLQETLNQLIFEKQRKADAAVRKNVVYQALEDFLGKVQSEASEHEVVNRHEKALQEFTGIHSVITILKQTFPELNEIADRIMLMVEDIEQERPPQQAEEVAVEGG